ncbi:MAG: neutral/alkaline non-lysosomal ceramidase N-terminal domain-containing protein [Bryobacterales bacterium]|nr:neutral/alkaline non-lysosomal ceramidase N-terminal domain-containing protein [Bryobacterales bacterium]
MAFSRRLLFLTAACVAALPAQTKQFRAGAFAADVTPQQWPVRIIGGFTQPLATKAHDPLHARAMVLDDGTTKLAFVVVDSCYLPRALYDRAKVRITANTGIPPTNMMMSATHAHSAPPSKPEGASEVELAYQKLLEDGIVKAVTEANKRLEPAQIGWAVRQEAEHLNNRRWYMKPGTVPPNPFGGTEDKVKMNPPSGSPNLIKPAGEVDPGFTVLAVKSASGKPIAVLGNYSLHYVGGIPGNELSADYFGEFANQLRDKLNAGPEFVGIMSNGTSGDVNNINFRTPRGRKAPFEQIKYVANSMSDHAVAAFKSASFQQWAPLAAMDREFPLRFRKPTPEQVEKAKQVLTVEDEKSLPVNAKAYARRTLKIDEGPEWADVKLQAFRIGTLGVTAFPFEVFTEIGLELKAKSPFKTQFTIELANGHYGYLPTPEQHELGGYETWLGTNYVEKMGSRKMTDALLGMLRHLAGTKTATASSGGGR